MVLPEVRSQLSGCYLNAFSKWLLGAGSKWSMVSALELREPVVFPLCSGYSEVCLWPFITSICSWNLLVCFLAWDLKCRPQHDILSRIYQVEFIRTIGRWLSPVSPNWRCCYISLATEQWEKFKSPGSSWMLSYLRELERKEIGPKLVMSEQALLCWEQQLKSIAPAGSLSPPWHGRRTQCCEWMAECPGGLLKCRLQVLLQGMWFPRGSGNLLTPSNFVLHTLACASHGQGLLLGTAVQGQQSHLAAHSLMPCPPSPFVLDVSWPAEWWTPEWLTRRCCVQ